ncbi:hypothetical protein BDF19DRAFT_433918 [Syncephalis fuscata]|nr:hypothetical protein BDF19DRAFT_433918 [Syncephalis fuscata]
MALPDLISTLLVPLGADKCYDRSQQRWTLLWVGCIMTMVHWYLGEGNSDQWHGLGAVVALMTLGLCYGIFSVIFWTALPQILPNMDHHPLAYARMTGLLNLSLVVVPFIVARTIAIDHSFQTTSRLFVVISLLATLTAGCLYATGTLDPAHPVMRADNDDTDQYEGDSDYADDYYNGYWSEEFSDAWESPDEHDDYEDDMRMDYEEDDDNAPNGIYFEPLPSAEAALRNYLPMNSNQSDDSRPRYETA